METKRPTIPAAEEILGGYFPVLDHGFVSLVDYMGDDASVERAARVSYGYGTRRSSQTRGLIRYLRRHQHTTPSEMVELKFHCAMPMFVARQWIRHRTACLAEGTCVYIDLPGGIERGEKRLYKLPIESIWERFQPTRNRTRPDKQRNPHFRRDRIRQMRVRQINDETNELRHTRIVDVFRNGRRPVFRMRLADGKEIVATADHRFLFRSGWSTLKDATGLHERNGKAVWTPGDYFLYVNGADIELPAYQDAEWLDFHCRTLRRRISDIAEESGVSYHTIRKWLTMHGLTEPGRGDFPNGHEPWNKGTTYRLGDRILSPEWIEANRKTRGGPASNFWRGGIADARSSLGRWTTQAAPRIHERSGWTCQLCQERAADLHCHHIVPVWAEERLARDESNLTTLCGNCHRSIAGNELEYVERLGGPPFRAEWQKRPRVAWNRLSVARLARIDCFEFVGERETYDLEVEGPYHNFIAEGIVTHNSVNEYSARYSLLPLLFYRPEREHFALQSASNRQGREAAAADEVLYQAATERWAALRAQAAETYGWLLEHDVAREIARIDLPLSTYTQWYWKIDLHSLLHFLTLRADPRAQWEIRAYAEVMAGMLKRVAPLTYEAWIDYDLAGSRLSRGELAALQRFISVDDDGSLRALADAEPLTKDSLAELGLSPREVRELVGKLQPAERPDFELDLSTMQTAEEVAARMEAAVPDVHRRD